MSVSYTSVGWNRQKKLYDAVLAASIVLFLVVFVAVAKLWRPASAQLSDEILLIRALGAAAILLLHIVLCIGPLARLDARFLPLLYNRRHLGVATFLLGLAHAALATVWYHGFGNVNPLVSLLTSNTSFTSLTGFPFELLGLVALGILFLLAATSHDFWLRNLTPSAWKSLHMLVYVAYALLIGHVALGFLQSERSPVIAALFASGLLLVSGLHIAAGWRERRRDIPSPEQAAPAPRPAPGTATQPPVGHWVDVGLIDDIPLNRAKTVCLRAPGGSAERIAVFRYDGKISAVSNVCEHQAGPLGEGKVIDGCITCPWHGYQYLPANGQSPPPFTDRIHTFRVTLNGRRILVDPTPLPKGTPVPPASFQEVH